MNVILLNYGSLENNSANHIRGFAECLSASGHDVMICAPNINDSGREHSKYDYRIISNRDAIRHGVVFKDGKDCDILHAWTPREIIRGFLEKYKNTGKIPAILIHLEDNELAIFERITGLAPSHGSADFICPQGLTNPLHLSDVLLASDGITMIHQCLEPLIPKGLQSMELPPVIDFDFFCSSPCHKESWSDLSSTRRPEILLGYNGNTHAANAADLNDLYSAVDILYREGLDIGMLRTGISEASMPVAYEFVKQGRHIDLGFVNRERLPSILREIDIVVQPGNADAFNAHRLPSKIPEYLAIGLPLITGVANIGAELERENAALVLQSCGAQDIAAAIRRLKSDPQLIKSISAAGKAFARRRFSAESIGPKLEAFYSHILERKKTRQS